MRTDPEAQKRAARRRADREENLASRPPECPGCWKPLAECVPCPEFPDETRIEFEMGTDVYAAWRSDQASGETGWTTGDGGETWCLFGRSVPVTWAELAADFGHCVLSKAVRLVPDPRDVGNYEVWPTAIYARQRAEQSAS